MYIVKLEQTKHKIQIYREKIAIHVSRLILDDKNDDRMKPLTYVHRNFHHDKRQFKVKCSFFFNSMNIDSEVCFLF